MMLFNYLKSFIFIILREGNAYNKSVGSGGKERD